MAAVEKNCRSEIHWLKKFFQLLMPLRADLVFSKYLQNILDITIPCKLCLDRDSSIGFWGILRNSSLRRKVGFERLHRNHRSITSELNVVEDCDKKFQIKWVILDHVQKGHVSQWLPCEAWPHCTSEITTSPSYICVSAYFWDFYSYLFWNVR